MIICLFVRFELWEKVSGFLRRFFLECRIYGEDYRVSSTHVHLLDWNALVKVQGQKCWALEEPGLFGPGIGPV